MDPSATRRLGRTGLALEPVRHRQRAARRSVGARSRQPGARRRSRRPGPAAYATSTPRPGTAIRSPSIASATFSASSHAAASPSRPRSAGSTGGPRIRTTSPSGLWTGGLPFELRFDYSYDGVMRSYEDSLQRLGLPRVDLLVIHDVDQGYHGDAAGVERCFAPARGAAACARSRSSRPRARSRASAPASTSGPMIGALPRPLRPRLLPGRDALHAARPAPARRQPAALRRARHRDRDRLALRLGHPRDRRDRGRPLQLRPGGAGDPARRPRRIEAVCRRHGVRAGRRRAAVPARPPGGRGDHPGRGLARRGRAQPRPLPQPASRPTSGPSSRPRACSTPPPRPPDGRAAPHPRSQRRTVRERSTPHGRCPCQGARCAVWPPGGRTPQEAAASGVWSGRCRAGAVSTSCSSQSRKAWILG